MVTIDDMPLSEIVEKALADQGLSQSEAARRARLSRSAISSWVSGRRAAIRPAEAQKLGPVIMVKPERLLRLPGNETFYGGEKIRTPPVTPSGKDHRSLPLCGAAAAGEPMAKIYEANDIQWMDFSETFLRAMYKGRFDPERAVMLRVEGDSMEGELPNGALVWIDRGPGGEGIEHVNEDDIYMVRPPGEDGITLKRVAIEGSGDDRVLQLLPSGRVVGRYKVRNIPLKGRKIQSIVRGRVVGQFNVVGRIGKVM